jgi:hypothetical protein
LPLAPPWGQGALALAPVDSITTHFKALSEDGSHVVDRMRYKLENVLLVSVALETSPTGNLQDTMGMHLKKVTWTSQPLNGGAPIETSWDTTAKGH